MKNMFIGIVLGAVVSIGSVAVYQTWLQPYTYQAVNQNLYLRSDGQLLGIGGGGDSTIRNIKEEGVKEIINLNGFN